MKIITYQEKYKQQIINLILNIQNNESKVNLTLQDQPDLKDINKNYIETGGNFWLVLNDNETVIGTLALMKKGDYAILKKFFIMQEYRGIGLSNKLYEQFLNHCKTHNLKGIILDTPSVCHRAHSFYLKNGFNKIEKSELPIEYNYLDRDSICFIKYL